MSTRFQKRDLLQPFSNETAYLLIEFKKHLAELQGDFVVFMARKALRLYDLLVLTGGPICKLPVLSDHVLDQDTNAFEGKKICLVDDTLILGTTLSEAKKRLEAAGAREVTCHVFAVDKENWCKDLVTPEKIFVHLDSARIRSFCAQEVSALSAAAIPYLSDFPFSEPLRLTRANLQILHALAGWDTHTLTAPIQDKERVFTYTLLPKRETQDLIENILGGPLASLLELTKVRAFGVHAGGAYWTRFVPIVTLRPVSEADVEKTFKQLIEKLEGQAGGTLKKLEACLTSAAGRMRFIQYTLSLAIGHTCLHEMSEAIERNPTVRFDLSEAVRLFGPWLRREIQIVHQTVPLVFRRETVLSEFNEASPSRSPLPKEVIEVGKAEYAEFVHGPHIGGVTTGQLARSGFTDLVQAFVGLHRKYEIPAREEAHRFGRRLFDSSAAEAPYRDRLKFGFAWHALADCVLDDGKTKLNLRRSNLLSLMLDCLIDMGIAVPFLCHRDGILFRAYRYGEDVEFGDQELALAYDAVKGYAESSERDEIPRVTLEKILSSFLHVGVARKFLKVIHGLSGTDGIARIGFHLHGAVPMVPKRDTIFADDQETWMSRYMQDRGALIRSPDKKGTYTLGTPPEGSFLSVDASSEAYMLGWLLGLLSAAKGDEGRPLLTQTDMIVLTSCIQPRYEAAALAAEIKLFTSWFEQNLRRFRDETEFAAGARTSAALKKLVQGQGYTALNSARLKIVAYANHRPEAIVNRCSAYLEALPNGAFLSAHWKSDWAAVFAGNSDEQLAQCKPLIDALGRETLVAAVGVFTMEMALMSARVAVGASGSGGAFGSNCGKIASYLEEVTEHCKDLSKSERNALERLVARAQSCEPMNRPKDAFEYGLKFLEERVPRMRSISSQTETMIRNFGKQDRRVNYTSVLWYDIIDSRAKKSGLTAGPHREYRSRVRSFKHQINQNIYGLVRDAARAGGWVHPWQGPLRSKDDEKHLFFAGTRSLSWLQQALEILISSADANGVCVRVLLVKTNFSGDTAYKYETEPAVEGELFWEHFSELRSKVKSIETELRFNELGRPPERSVIWLAGDLVEDLNLPMRLSPKSHLREVDTEVDQISVVTSIVGGPVPRWNT